MSPEDKLILKLNLPYLFNLIEYDHKAAKYQLYLYEKGICPVEWVEKNKERVKC